MVSVDSPNTTVATSDDRLARGRARMRELAVEQAAQAKVEVARLTADLRREPSAAESIVIEQIAHLAVRSRRLRALGRFKEAETASMLISRLLGRLNLPSPDAKPAEDFATLMRRLATPGGGDGP